MFKTHVRLPVDSADAESFERVPHGLIGEGTYIAEITTKQQVYLFNHAITQIKQIQFK